MISQNNTIVLIFAAIGASFIAAFLILVLLVIWYSIRNRYLRREFNTDVRTRFTGETSEFKREVDALTDGFR